MNLGAEATFDDQPNKTHHDLLYHVNSTMNYTMMVEEHRIDRDMNISLAINTQGENTFAFIIISVANLLVCILHQCTRDNIHMFLPGMRIIEYK